MHKTRVGILRGGPSSEYEVSLNTGASILSTLRENHDGKYQLKDIFIDRAGAWHIEGLESRPEEIIHKVDVVFNALHGTYGEDGKVQRFFEIHQVPFTGSGSLASAVGMNKILSKKRFMDHGLKTPHGKYVSHEDMLGSSDDLVNEIYSTCTMPAVIKPSDSGSSVGVSIVRTKKDILPAIIFAAQESDHVIIEEYIQGIEATCGVVEGFRGHALYALPPVEIRPTSSFFDYDAKYKGKSEEIVPATFPSNIKTSLEEMAKEIHRALGLKHYSRSDFIVHPRRGIYVLEVNTLPGLTTESLLPKALRAVGSSLHEFADHLIQLAMRKGG